MISVLGIDAAWTDHEPSGVALVTGEGAGHWRCRCVAPSYASFTPSLACPGKLGHVLTAAFQDAGYPIAAADEPPPHARPRYEDAIDALVCAWVGCRYAEGHATSFGDKTAAICVKKAYQLANVDDREEDPSCTLIQSHQKFE